MKRILLIAAVLIYGMNITGSELEWIRPFDGEVKISSRFGVERSRHDGGMEYVNYHQGIDYAVPVDTKIIATNDGQLVFSRCVKGYGYLMIIDHGKNLKGKAVSSWYAHLSEPLILKGTFVRKGDVIALSGDSGNAQGKPHLHFEMRENDYVVHPAKYIIRQGKE